MSFTGTSLSSDSHKVSRFGFGGKSFGFITSVALLLNNIAGIEVLRSGIVIEAGGWLVCLVTLVVVSLVALFASLFLAKAIATLPDNINYKYRIEFSRLAQRLFPRWMYVLVLLLVIVDLLLCNLDSITVSAEIMDNSLLHVFGRTCAWVLNAPTKFECLHDTSGNHAADDDNAAPNGFNTSPWGPKYIVSLGWLLVVVVCLPLSCLSLASTWIPQLLAFSIRICCQLIWIFQLFALGTEGGYVPAVGTASQMKYTNFASAMVFMFSCVITVPSWLNEKKAHVPVVLSTSIAVGVACGLYLLLGILSAVVLDFPPGTDLASVLVNSPGVWTITKVSVYVFPFSDLLARIPVFSIVARYNLINTRVASPWVVRIITIILPAVLAILDYNGNTGHTVIIWIATVGLPIINFMMPVSTYISLRMNGADKYTLPIEMSTEELTERPPTIPEDEELLTEMVDQTEQLPGLRVPHAKSSALSFLLPSWARPLVPSAITARTQRRVIAAQQRRHNRVGVSKERSERRIDTSSSMLTLEIETMSSNYALSTNATQSSRYLSETSLTAGQSQGSIFDSSLFNVFSSGKPHEGGLAALPEEFETSSASMPLVSSEERAASAEENAHPYSGEGFDASFIVQNMKLNVDKVIPIVPPKLRKYIREQTVAVSTIVAACIIAVLCAVLQIINTTATAS